MIEDILKLSKNIELDKEGFCKCKIAIFEIPEYMKTAIEEPFGFESFIEKSKDVINKTVKEYLDNEKLQHKYGIDYVLELTKKVEQKKTTNRPLSFTTKLKPEDIDKAFSTDFTAEISALRTINPDVVYIKRRPISQQLVFNEKLNRLSLVIKYDNNTYESESVETTDENFVSWEFAYLLLKAKIHMGRTEFHKFVDYIWKRFKRPTRRMFDYLEGVIGQYEGYEQIEEDINIVKSGYNLLTNPEYKLISIGFVENNLIKLSGIRTIFKLKQK